MFLADYHVHSTFSPDAEDSMSVMAQSALDNGISQLCFTNHVESCSADDPPPLKFPPFEKWDEQRREYEAVKAEFAGKLNIRLGAEVGSINHKPDIAEDIYLNQPFDFVLGSIHNLRDSDDFYYMDYTGMTKPEYTKLVEKYLLEYIEISKLGLCDVLGHIGYMQRYMARKGITFDLIEFTPYLEEIFHNIVSRGIGIEVNTSSLHDALGRLIPDLPVIKLYRQCGGEIITAGSDSHRAEHAGYGIATAYEAIRNAGFEYITVFKEHKPEFIKLT